MKDVVKKLKEARSEQFDEVYQERIREDIAKFIREMRRNVIKKRG
jgi:hypothetical protein